MKNTFIPLSIAFIDVDGKIVNIEDMRRRTSRRTGRAESRCMRSR